VSRAVEELNRRLLRARDAMDRAYAEPLDVRAIGAVAHMSEAHFIRSFKVAFGETPHRYLQRRRVERAMFLLRETTRSITDICFDVGFMSLGTFSRTFREIVGETPSAYREGHDPIEAPHCFQTAYTRPRVAAGVVARAAQSAARHAARQSGSSGEAPASRGSLALAPFTTTHQERPA
jgi:AraC-like DNA-binding protein